jgi:hypothetical protein
MGLTVCGGCFRPGIAGYCADMAFHVTHVQMCLKGFDYPGTAAELAEHAQSNGADPRLVDTLRALKRESFDGLDEVMSSLSAQNVLGG